MNRRYDVVIVGGRCAGAPLAVHLARAGLDVAVVDRDTFPSETLSTHIFQVEGVLCLQRLGVFDDVVATGAPPIELLSFQLDDVEIDYKPRLRPGDPCVGIGVRREALTILLDAAREAGAEVHEATAVRGLVRDGGRVVGVEVERDGARETLDAALVVGADGRTSTVARLVDARRYHETPSPRVFVWGYFTGAADVHPARAHFRRVGDDALLAFPTDDGAYLTATAYGVTRKPSLFGLDDHGFATVLRSFPQVEAVLSGATRLGGWRVVTRYDGFLRESAGPGWVLVGDAGHFKDPTPGQGISDAFRQVERLAPAIVRGLGDGDLDAELEAWWCWRDDDAVEKHWFASDLGAEGEVPVLLEEMVRRVVAEEATVDDFFDIFAHRVRPSEVFRPTVLLGSLGSLLARGPRRQALREAGTLMATEARRRRLRRRPSFSA